MIESARRRRLFGQQSAVVRVLPFGLVLCVAFALYPLAGGARGGGREQLLAALLAGATVAAAAFAPWRRLPPAAGLVPLLLFLATAALLRDVHGGSLSGYAPLVVVPVLWAGAFGRWRDIAALVAAVGLTLGLPVVLAGAPAYPPGEVRRAVLMTFVAAIAAAGIALLLRALALESDRREAAERALERVYADEVHDDIVQSLAAAQLALALENRAAAESALAHALATAEDVVVRMLRASGADARPGSNRRRQATPR